MKPKGQILPPPLTGTTGVGEGRIAFINTPSPATAGVGDGQGGLACCGSWFMGSPRVGHDERLNS